MPQVNSVILKTLGKIILTEIDFPKGVFFTLTRVDTAPSLDRAEVYFSVFPPDKVSLVEQVLSDNIYKIQQYLNKQMHIKRVPKIEFIYDKEEKQAFAVEELLDKLSETE